MPNRIPVASVSLAALLVPLGAMLPGCDEGRLAPDGSAPKLARLLVQDVRNFGGRRQAVDLINASPPGRKCSTTDPCVLGERYENPPCRFPDPAKDEGYCPNPLRPAETLVGTTPGLEGTQVRYVFSKILFSDIQTSEYDAPQRKTIYTLKPEVAAAISVVDGNGKELASTKFYDLGGSFDNTSDLFGQPYGPALVVKLKPQLVPLASYTVKFDPSVIRDGTGQPLQAKDRWNNDVKRDYPFTVEDVYPIDPHSAGGTVGYDQVKGIAGGQSVKPQQAVVLILNWPIDPKTLKVKLTDAMGQEVRIAASVNVGLFPSICSDNLKLDRIDVLPLDASGKRLLRWPLGEYGLDVEAEALDLKVPLKSEPTGKAMFKGVKFKVEEPKTDEAYKAEDDPFAFHINCKKDPMGVETCEKANFLLPSECAQ